MTGTTPYLGQVDGESYVMLMYGRIEPCHAVADGPVSLIPNPHPDSDVPTPSGIQEKWIK